jgi:hypothetical protein
MAIAALILAAMFAQPPPSMAPASTPSPAPVASGAPIVTVPGTWRKEPDKNDPSSSANLGEWVHDSAQGTEFITVVFTVNFGVPIERVAQMFTQRMEQQHPGITFGVNQAQTLCNGLGGWQLSFHQKLGAVTMDVTQILAATPTVVYLASYAHPASFADSADGLASARSLCPPVATLEATPSPPAMPPPSI